MDSEALECSRFSAASISASTAVANVHTARSKEKAWNGSTTLRNSLGLTRYARDISHSCHRTCGFVATKGAEVAHVTLRPSEQVELVEHPDLVRVDDSRLSLVERDHVAVRVLVEANGRRNDDQRNGLVGHLNQGSHAPGIFDQRRGVQLEAISLAPGSPDLAYVRLVDHRQVDVSIADEALMATSLLLYL